jgi:hypothetical protein
VVSFTPRMHYPQGRSPRHPLGTWASLPVCLLHRREISVVLPGIEPRFFCLPACLPVAILTELLRLVLLSLFTTTVRIFWGVIGSNLGRYNSYLEIFRGFSQFVEEDTEIGPILLEDRSALYSLQTPVRNEANGVSLRQFTRLPFRKVPWPSVVATWRRCKGSYTAVPPLLQCGFAFGRNKHIDTGCEPFQFPLSSPTQKFARQPFCYK